MRFWSDCVPCLLRVRINEVEMLVGSPDADRAVGVSMELLRALYDEYARGNVDIPVVATKLFRLVKRELGVDDPYKEIKRAANKAGLAVYRALRSRIDRYTLELRFELAVRAATVGNALDLGVAGFRPPEPSELISEILRARLDLQGHLRIRNRVEGKLVAYLLDNSGEAALDRLLAEVMRDLGAEVVAVVKGGAFQNDVTYSEVGELGLLESFDDVVSTGTDAASVFFGELSPEARRLLERADLIVAKGMAHYEYLSDKVSDLGKPVLFLLKAKCRPVATSLNVSLGAYVSKLMTGSSERH